MDERIGNFYFMQDNGDRVLLAENVNCETAFLVMQKFLNEHNYKSYYTRSWEQDGSLWMDFGSWSQFMILDFKEVDECGKQERT